MRLTMRVLRTESKGRPFLDWGLFVLTRIRGVAAEGMRLWARKRIGRDGQVLEEACAKMLMKVRGKVVTPMLKAVADTMLIVRSNAWEGG